LCSSESYMNIARACNSISIYHCCWLAATDAVIAIIRKAIPWHAPCMMAEWSTDVMLVVYWKKQKNKYKNANPFLFSRGSFVHFDYHALHFVLTAGVIVVR
jgi:hypothetical protein